MKQEQQENIIKHGLNLIKFFNLSPETDPLKLCKSLRRLENKTHALTLRQCNEGNKETDEKTEKDILNKVDKLLNFREQNINVFINGDPRGYALKINSKHSDRLREVGLFIDWGYFGIIAPEF